MDPASIRRALLAWYRRNARDLPWRRTADPYAIWVSEVMLQQTQVATVTPYFVRFIERFPTLDALRKASKQAVLAEWQGLGYYRRAHNLHTAASAISRVPRKYEALRALPGIGEYTASAIASIAFGEKRAAVDGNVERVLSRLFCLNETGVQLRHRCRSLSLELMGNAHPGEWNQAVMELGATICRPFDPDCGNCPVARSCKANLKRKVSCYPRKGKGSQRVRSRHVCVCPVRGGRFGLRQIPEGNWWSGLWEFPRLETRPDESESGALARLGYPNASPLTTIRHSVSHHSIILHAFISRDRLANGVEKWVAFEQLDSLPLPAPQRKVAEFAKRAVSLR